MLTINKNENNNTLIKSYLLIVVFLCILCWLFPYTGDDWAWGSSIGIGRLDNWFENYSGRYFGNLIVLILTRSRLIRTMTMVGCIVGIIALINKLTEKSKLMLGVNVLCLIFLPVAMLRQSIVWTSGFANYTTSIFLTLIYVKYVDNIYEVKKPVYSFKIVVPLFLLGVANTLIVEHITLYNVILAVYVVVFSALRFKKLYLNYLAYMIGAFVGTMYMFSNECYQSVVTGQDTYRSIGSGSGIIVRVASNYFNIIMKEGVLNNWAINLLISVLCIMLFNQFVHSMKKGAKRLGCISLFAICSYSAISVMNSYNSFTEYKGILLIEGVMTLIYALALFVFIWVLPIKRMEKYRIEFIMCSIACMMGPLLVVTPIGSRCFFGPYVLFIYLIGRLYCNLDEDIRVSLMKGTKWIAIVAFVGYMYLLCIYGTIYVADNNRIDKARDDALNGMEIIEVKNLPYSEYVWCANPQKDTCWEDRFKLFYEIDQEVQINNIEENNNP